MSWLPGLLVSIGVAAMVVYLLVVLLRPAPNRTYYVQVTQHVAKDVVRPESIEEMADRWARELEAGK